MSQMTEREKQGLLTALEAEIQELEQRISDRRWAVAQLEAEASAAGDAPAQEPRHD